MLYAAMTSSVSDYCFDEVEDEDWARWFYSLTTGGVLL